MNDIYYKGPERPVARMVSWNLWWRFGEGWEERQHTIAATLADLEPDIIGLQEVWATKRRSASSMLADSFGFYSAFAGPSLPPVPQPPESPDQDDVELGVAIVSRWPIRHTWTHSLPSSRPQSPVALVAVVDHPLGLLPAVSTCLEWEPSLADDHLTQAQDLKELTDALARHGRELPLVLMGDLNAPPDNPGIKILTDAMVDSWTVSGDPEGITLSTHNPYAPREATEQIDRRIDYVLARAAPGQPPPQVRHAFLAGTVPAESPPSDHYAVVADVTL
jgi:endonuclease/exonuclease/phosphatase family metal-dependent hydrolase